MVFIFSIIVLAAGNVKYCQHDEIRWNWAVWSIGNP